MTRRWTVSFPTAGEVKERQIQSHGAFVYGELSDDVARLRQADPVPSIGRLLAPVVITRQRPLPHAIFVLGTAACRAGHDRCEVLASPDRHCNRTGVLQHATDAALRVVDRVRGERLDRRVFFRDPAEQSSTTCHEHRRRHLVELAADIIIEPTFSKHVMKGSPHAASFVPLADRRPREVGWFFIDGNLLKLRPDVPSHGEPFEKTSTTSPLIAAIWRPHLHAVDQPRSSVSEPQFILRQLWASSSISTAMYRFIFSFSCSGSTRLAPLRRAATSRLARRLSFRRSVR